MKRGQKNLLLTDFYLADTRHGRHGAFNPTEMSFGPFTMNAKKISIINVREKKLISTISFEGG